MPVKSESKTETDSVEGEATVSTLPNDVTSFDGWKTLLVNKDEKTTDVYS